MVKNFFIKNFKCIKDRLDISFEPSSLNDETYFENVFHKGELSLSKVIAIYGNNASGKSTIAEAFSIIKELVIPLDNGPLLPYYPFVFDIEMINAPTEVGIEFSLDNNDDSFIYRYYIKYDDKRIIEEKFEKLTSQKYSLIYHRYTDIDNKVSINIGNNASNGPLLQALIDSIVPNRTFLSMFSRFKVSDLYDAYTFFLERFYNSSLAINSYIEYSPTKIEKDEGLKRFTLSLLKAADFNIRDITIDKIKIPKYVNNQPILSMEKDTLYLWHDNYKLDFSNESLGTKKIILVAEALYSVFQKPSVIIIDELEASLHPELTKLIVTCFLDETINVNNSQLIFTSHETTLLDLNLLRRDQIIFVYKDSHNSTYIRSLKEFHVKKSDSVAKSYLSGRYMTSPDVNQSILNNGN